MLKINISARGKEHYAVFYPEKEFNEDEFMEEHSEDYMELSDDNIDMEMWNLNMQCCINVNGKDIKIDDDFVENSSAIQGNEPTKRQIAGADEADVAVCWEHPGVIEYDFSWNDVNDFDSSKVKIYFFEEGEDVFNFITYDDNDPDDMDLVSIEPKGGFEGLLVLFPGDDSGPQFNDAVDDSITSSEQITDGINTQYYENGQKESEGNYKDGKEEGLHTTWYENGQKESEGNYKDGKEEGLHTTWYENGQKEAEYNFKDGMRNGKLTQWEENGCKWEEGYYINDKPDKLFGWHENGQKRCEESWKDGEMDGEWISWYENGQKESEGNYKDGKEEGLHTIWHENGQRAKETNWNNGIRGKITHWNEDGE
jgi:antitoxin component YwqK of YwqJK toxin-antitoxin module